MSDILCIYYSRTGNTKKAMEEIASALDAELAELRDGVDRSGWKGWLRCGLDAMRRSTRPVAPVETARPLGDYRLVILGTPVWAGRYSAVMRAFLKERGGEIQNAAYVLTRSSEYNVSLKIGSSEDGLNTHINVEISKEYIDDKMISMLLVFAVTFAVALIMIFELLKLPDALFTRISRSLH